MRINKGIKKPPSKGLRQGGIEVGLDRNGSLEIGRKFKRDPELNN